MKAPISSLLSLRSRLFFLICLATLPAILFTFFVAENEQTATLARTEREALHLAGLASREHAHQIRGARELLAWLGETLTKEGLKSPIMKDNAFFSALQVGHPQLANIGVLSPDGQVLLSAYPLPNYRSWDDNPAYLAALKTRNVATGTYLISPIFDRPTLNHAFAVRDLDDRVIAVLFSGIDLGWLSALDWQSDLPEGFSMLIVDRQGRVLTDGNSADAGPSRIVYQRIPEVVELSRSEHGRVIQADNPDFSRYFVASPLEEAQGLYVVVGIPYERVVRQANLTFYRTIAALGILTVFIITSVFVAAEIGILRSLRALARVAKRFGAGDLLARAKSPRAHNEIASLVSSFNSMADALARRHREALDAQVRLRALASRLQSARETEAARISRDLHDEIGQMLTSLKMDLARLPSCCLPGEPFQSCATALGESARAMSGQIDEAVAFVRRISSDLRPGVLDKLGLTAALEWQAHETETRTGLVVQVEADVVDENFDELLSVTLFRIAQEALNNVVLHAEAKIVEIGLHEIAEGTVLTIQDDGKGITRDEIASGESLGIIGMSERAMLINGKLSIRGDHGRGTVVSVVVPLHTAQEVTSGDSSG